nr:hypothetical protein B0A51_15601 [Rachicladosporium sp. CCFEE 5018]
MKSNDTSEGAQVTGSLGQDGITILKSGAQDLTVDGVRAHDFASRSRSESALHDNEDSDDSVEDYDDIRLDPDTLVANTMPSVENTLRPSGKKVMKDDYKRRQSEPGVDLKTARKGIQIKLEKTDRKGRYVLTADDPEIREILRKGLEREEREAAGKRPRTRIRDLVFTRQFTTFDRQNPTSAESPFFGFFTLFWLAMVLIFVQTALNNWSAYGSILGDNQIAKLMFSRELLTLGITDGVICAATSEAYFLQLAISKGWINWAKSGWIIQNLWQTAYLGTILWWTWFRDWPWTHSVFIVLHALVFVMKQHSYAFYNGYLSGVYRRRALLERKLKQLDAIEPVSSPPSSPLGMPSFGARSASVDLGKPNEETGSTLKPRRPFIGNRTSTNLAIEKSDVASVASAIESGKPLDLDQLQAFRQVIQEEIAELTTQLSGKSQSPTSSNIYPHNLRLGNFAEFICLPTLVYELEYPRQERINWWYVAEKTTATFGVLCVMQVISQAFIYPPVAKTVAMKEAGLTMAERWVEFPFIVSDMLFALLLEQLLTWYVIWECILNVLAEVTRFADRGFYGDWWNSVSWDQYARDWNRPVHNFLLRHVYHSSISTFHLSRHSATFVTFLLSALVHELVMAVMFKKVRGYLFAMQLLQMPLVSLSRTKLLKGRTILGNVIFWLGLFVGPSFLTSLYLIL